MRRFILLSVAAAATLSLSVPASAASGWSAPARIDSLDVSRLADGPSVVQHDGKLYVAIAADGIVLLSNASGSWQRARLTHDSQRPGHVRIDDQPSLAVGADGFLHVAFARLATTSADCAGTGCGHTALMYATNRSGSWKVGLIEKGDDAFPSLAMSQTGHPVIAYQRGPRIRLVDHRASGWWSYDIGGGATTELPRPGAPRLAFRYDEASIVYTRVQNGHDTIRLIELSSDTSAEQTIGRGQDPDIAVDANHHLRIAYIADPSGDLVTTTRSDHGVWTTEKVASDVVPGYRPSIAIVGADRLAIVAQRDDRSKATGGSGDILFRTDRTGSWTGGLLTNLATEGLPADRLPAVVVGPNGKATVVFIRESGSAHPHDTLWVTRQQ